MFNAFIYLLFCYITSDPINTLTWALVLPSVGQPKFSNLLGKCAPNSNRVLLIWAHYQISNVISYIYKCIFVTVFQ